MRELCLYAVILMSDTAQNDPIFPSYAGYLYVPREKHTLHFVVCYCMPQWEAMLCVISFPCLIEISYATSGPFY